MAQQLETRNLHTFIEMDKTETSPDESADQDQPTDLPNDPLRETDGSALPTDPPTDPSEQRPRTDSWDWFDWCKAVTALLGWFSFVGVILLMLIKEFGV